jgi:glutamate-1-semialdehyde 2,1-aminomutase
MPKTTVRESARINADMTLFKKLFSALLNRGIYIGPSGYEVGFISQAHTKKILDVAIEKFCDALDEVM